MAGINGIDSSNVSGISGVNARRINTSTPVRNSSATEVLPNNQPQPRLSGGADQTAKNNIAGLNVALPDSKKTIDKECVKAIKEKYPKIYNKLAQQTNGTPRAILHAARKTPDKYQELQGILSEFDAKRKPDPAIIKKQAQEAAEEAKLAQERATSAESEYTRQEKKIVDKEARVARQKAYQEGQNFQEACEKGKLAGKTAKENAQNTPEFQELKEKIKTTKENAQKAQERANELKKQADAQTSPVKTQPKPSTSGSTGNTKPNSETSKDVAKKGEGLWNWIKTNQGKSALIAVAAIGACIAAYKYFSNNKQVKEAA